MNSNHDTASETAPVARQGANNAPETKTTTKKATTKKGAPKPKKATRQPKTTKKTTSTKGSKKAATAGVPREFSKKNAVLDLLRRKEGATLAEIAKATDWQNHSIRGFISGQLTKKMGLKVESAKNDAGERTYRIIAN
jgi:hypothetical protein